MAGQAFNRVIAETWLFGLPEPYTFQLRLLCPPGRVCEDSTTSTTSTTTTTTATVTTTTSSAPRQVPPARADTGPDHFFSPSRNIACVLRETLARCDIGLREWEPPPKPTSCQVDWGYNLSVVRNSPGQFGCTSDTAGHAPAVLPYGSVARRGPFECRSRETGMECVNLDTAHGFRGEPRRVSPVLSPEEGSQRSLPQRWWR